MSKIAPLLLVAGVLLAAATPADAVLCAKKSGALFSRETCRRKEVQVDPAQAGLVGPKGDPGAPGVGQPRLFLTDANGTRLPGFVNGRGQLVYPLEDAAFALQVGVDGFRDVGFFYFESDDCSGPRLLFKSDDVVQFGTVNGGHLHYVTEPSQTTTYNATAFVTRSDLCTSTGEVFDPVTKLCCRKTAAPESDDLSPAVTHDLGGFVPPFVLGIEP